MKSHCCNPRLNIGSNNKHKSINRGKNAQKCASDMLEHKHISVIKAENMLISFLKEDFFLD